MECSVFFYTQKSERRCANACSFDCHRLAPAHLGFRAGVLRQRHGCSPDRGDCHSFHFSPRRLRELKKRIHFFIKGLDKTKIMLTGADFVSKISRAQRIKQLGSRFGSMAFPEFPKAERKREKAPKSYDFGSFSWRRRRDLNSRAVIHGLHP